MELITMAILIINPSRTNILKHIHRIFIQINKTLDLHTTKLTKTYPIHLHKKIISTKATSTGTLQGQYQRVMDVAKWDILREIVTIKKTENPTATWVCEGYRSKHQE